MSLVLSFAPLACGSDDDDDDDGSGARGGTSSKAGTTGQGGTAKAGASAGGSNSLGGEATSGAAGSGGEGGSPVLETARVRVIHASPNAPAVDVYAHDSATSAAEGLAYGEVTGMIEVAAGTLAFDLRAAGAAATAAPAFTSDDIELTAGAEYTLIAAGDFADAADPDVGFRLLALEHDFEAAAAGTVVTRVVHATSAWASVDLDVASTTGVDLPGLTRFGDESNVELPAAATIDVSFATEADGTLSQLTLPELTAGDELFVIATGNPGFPFRAPANGFALLVVDQDGNTSWVREQPWLHLVHASDVGIVDVYEAAQTAVDARLADNVPTANMVRFQLPASVAGFTLKAVDDASVDGSATALAEGETSTLENGEHYLSYISGPAINTLREQFDLTQSTRVMLRGVHAAESVTESVDFGPSLAGVLQSALIVNVAPSEASAEPGVALDPADITLGVSATGLLTALEERAFAGEAAPVAGERDFVLLVDGATTLRLVNTSVAGWSLR